MTESTASVVAELNVALGTGYRLVRQLAGGFQSGAFELSGGVVLKWTDNPGWAPRVRQAAELVQRARAAGYPTPEWLLEGWDGVWERVRPYGGELLRRYAELCAPYHAEPLPDDDFVHGDLNLGNLIVDSGRITGIVDIEAAAGGSRAYDLVCLAASAARDGAQAGVDELFVLSPLITTTNPSRSIRSAHPTTGQAFPGGSSESGEGMR